MIQRQFASEIKAFLIEHKAFEQFCDNLNNRRNSTFSQWVRHFNYYRRGNTRNLMYADAITTAFGWGKEIKYWSKMAKLWQDRFYQLNK